MSDHEEFFNRMADFRIESRFYENGESFDIEELYQAFKSRLLEEMQANAKEEMEQVVSMLMRGDQTIN